MSEDEHSTDERVTRDGSGDANVPTVHITRSSEDIHPDSDVSPNARTMTSLAHSLPGAPSDPLPEDAMPTRDSAFRAGACIGEWFVLVRRLGAGGMGEVFMARDERLYRRVAIKTLHIGQLFAPERRERFIRLFRRDAASTAQLNHPNIVTVYSFGEYEGIPFMVLEYVKGTPLDALLHQEGALPEHQVLALAKQLARALRYAHEQGVIHRDIKPANLMRTDDGHLKVLDFGVALMRDAQDALLDSFERTSEELEQDLGHAPRAAGTPAYMAPEQMMGLVQDERVDVWAFGVTLYELLTGQRPSREQERAIGSFDLDWTLAPHVSQSTRQLVEACLVVSTKKRLADFDAVLRAIDVDTHVSSLDAAGLARPRTNLVRHEDAFVPRAELASELEAWFAQESSRLLTVTGPPGAGKSRVVHEWAWGLVERESAAHVVHVDLSEVVSTQGLLFAMGDALGVALTQKDPEQQLVWALEARPGVILVVEHVEPMLDIAATQIMRWLEGAPKARVVVTSRSLLGVVGERVVRVEPMHEGSLGVELFSVRAREAHERWVCPEGQQGALEELVLELDGLPLAIELAAARARMLPPAKMLERMNRRFVLLRSSRRGLSAREATLQGALQWSWELLSETQRAALAQLSVFEGGCSLEDAEDVLDLEVVEDDEFPFVIDVVEQLLDASLLRSDPVTSRLSMLSSVRVFASRQLEEASWGDGLRERFARHVARWGEPEVLERALRSSTHELIADADNLEAASRWGTRPGASAEQLLDGLRATHAWCVILEMHGPFAAAFELRERIERVAGRCPHGEHHALAGVASLLTKLGDREPARVIYERAERLAREHGDAQAARLHRVRLAQLVMMMGDAERAESMVDEVLEQAQRSGETLTQGWAHSVRYSITHRQARYDEALEAAERASELFASLGDEHRMMMTTGNTGNVLHSLGRSEEARSIWERALELARRIGDTRLEAVWLGNLGIAAWRTKELDAARAYMLEAKEIAQKIGDRQGEGIQLGHLGNVYEDEGRIEDAVAAWREAATIAVQTSEPWRESLWLANIGSALVVAGRHEDARAPLSRALELSPGNPRRLAMCHGYLGQVAHHQGDEDAAREHLARAMAALDGLGIARSSAPGKAAVVLADVLGEEVPDGVFGSPD